MTILSRDDILKAQDLPSETVHIPEWGGDVIVKTLTGKERDAFETSLYEGSGNNRRQNLKNIRAKLVVRAVVDAEGNRIFTDADVEKLGNKSAAALDRIFDIVQRRNKISESDMEEMAGNLQPDQS